MAGIRIFGDDHSAIYLVPFHAEFLDHGAKLGEVHLANGVIAGIPVRVETRMVELRRKTSERHRLPVQAVNLACYNPPRVLAPVDAGYVAHDGIALDDEAIDELPVQADPFLNPEPGFGGHRIHLFDQYHFATPLTKHRPLA